MAKIEPESCCMLGAAIADPTTQRIFGQRRVGGQAAFVTFATVACFFARRIGNWKNTLRRLTIRFFFLEWLMFADCACRQGGQGVTKNGALSKTKTNDKGRAQVVD